MQSLGVKCKGCGTVFATGILMGAYGRPVLAATTWPCPHCHARGSYRCEDFVALVG